MADDIDLAQACEELDREAAIAARPSPKLAPGVPGDCEYCGEWFSRLVGGACGFCRDRYKLP
ncbi:hypothetical protein [Pararhodobacter sp.]|uniref:hypothetical protein n=1 Tax=Pararhodobacter sp. TaxID=2127056 RepID=UPI002AFED26F|nr:hypothetical protein [Pararhodobacter sp.]